SVTFSGSTVVVVPAGDDAVDVVVVVFVTAAAGVAALVEVCVNRTGEFSLAFAAGLAAWIGAAGLTAVWACEKDNAATKATVAKPKILREVAIVMIDERMPGCLKQEADHPGRAFQNRGTENRFTGANA